MSNCARIKRLMTSPQKLMAHSINYNCNSNYGYKDTSISGVSEVERFVFSGESCQSKCICSIRWKWYMLRTTPATIKWSRIYVSYALIYISNYIYIYIEPADRTLSDPTYITINIYFYKTNDNLLNTDYRLARSILHMKIASHCVRVLFLFLLCVRYCWRYKLCI